VTRDTCFSAAQRHLMRADPVIARLIELDHLPSSDEVLAIAEPWRPYRTLATSYLFASAFGGD